MPETIAVSHIVFQEHNSEQWVECKLCGFRAGQITSHINAYHDISSVEYKKLHGNTICQKNRDRVKGENNPAYQHGGKFSPFSEKFVKYENMDIEDRTASIAESFKLAKDSILDHPENRMTNPEYWMKTEGVSRDEAIKMVSERQSTFSLDICIEKFGEDAGLEIWQARQDKWQDNLTSKTDEETEEINRKKSSRFSFQELWTNNYPEAALFYVIRLPNTNLKIGITTKEILQRYTPYQLKDCVIEYSSRDTLTNCFKLEQLIKRKVSSFGIKSDEQIGIFGWTETFKNIEFPILLEEIDKIKESGIDDLFAEAFPKHHQKICITDTSQ